MAASGVFKAKIYKESPFCILPVQASALHGVDEVVRTFISGIYVVHNNVSAKSDPHPLDEKSVDISACIES